MRLPWNSLPRHSFGSPRRNKYAAVKTEYGGRKFDSKKEARHAQHLDTLRLASDPWERVVDIKYQKPIELQPEPHRIVYKADFWVTYADGRIEIHEVKGFRTAAYRIKRKLLLQKFPDMIFREI